MKIRNVTYHGRKAWEFDNDAIRLTLTAGGGHIASLLLDGGPQVNPLWLPIWKTIEPWQYKPSHAARYSNKLLGSLLGHNLCLGCFGGPSPEEAKVGMSCHGEAPVARWTKHSAKVGATGMTFQCGCELPEAGMTLTRTISAKRGRNVIRVAETIRNNTRCDTPYTQCEHVTMGPPFLEKGVTVFDTPATKCHTFPGQFGTTQRFSPNTSFQWPNGPGIRGRNVDLRTIAKEDRASSDYTTQLIDPRRDDAWFSAFNPKLGMVVAYVWKRADFPWLGNWEENYGRKELPWAGKSLTRGMEFANSPFPMSLRSQVDMGTFHNQPTFRWLPARGKVTVEYDILVAMVPFAVKGVADIQRSAQGLNILFKR